MRLIIYIYIYVFLFTSILLFFVNKLEEIGYILKKKCKHSCSRNLYKQRTQLTGIPENEMNPNTL